MNHEDNPNGLLIVRASDSQPSHSEPTHTKHSDVQIPRFPSEPSSSTHVGFSQPPIKKFRADNQPLARIKEVSQTKNVTRDQAAEGSDMEVEKDVKAMDDEADRLRRLSRARSTVDPSLLSSQARMHFPSRSEPPGTSRKGKSKALDISTPLPSQETPIIERNKQLRSGLIATNRRGHETDMGTPTETHRRRSSVSGRGKRVSSSFEATGIISGYPTDVPSLNLKFSMIIAQPHNSVSESSFFKHIDVDLPEPERIRQLLIWCSLRAFSSLTSSASSSSTKLPPLSTESVQILKTVQEDVVRKLAEKKIGLSFYSSESNGTTGDLLENEQNIRNRMCEVTYSDHIKQCVLFVLYNLHYRLHCLAGHRQKKKNGRKCPSNTTCT